MTRALVTLFLFFFCAPTVPRGFDDFAPFKKYYPGMSFVVFKYATTCTRDKKERAEILAIMKAESNFKSVISKSGRDFGPMQVNIAHDKNPEKFLDLRIGIIKGVAIWRSAKARSRGDIPRALAYYNAGNNANLHKYKGWKTYVFPAFRNIKNTEAL